MTFCLSCNDDRIKLQELHKKFVALLTDWLSLMAFEYFRTENRIMLCKWFVSFDMEIRLTVSGYAVKGYRFFRYECKRRWMFSFIINDINGVKNLHGLMSVHGWTDLCNHFKIPVNEFTQPAVIVNRPCA